MKVTWYENYRMQIQKLIQNEDIVIEVGSDKHNNNFAEVSLNEPRKKQFKLKKKSINNMVTILINVSIAKENLQH